MPQNPDIHTRPFLRNIIYRTVDYIRAFPSEAGHHFVFSASLGLAYVHHQVYRYGHSASEGTSLGLSDNPTDLWLENLGHMKWCWKTYSHISLGTLPLMFPMFASTGLPVCSTSRLIVTLALLSGISSLLLCSLYRADIRVLMKERAATLWVEASGRKWSQSNRSFWMFLCLPTLWFLLYFLLLVTSIAFPLWEIISVPSTAKICSTRKLKVFGYSFLVVLLTSVAHLAFATFALWVFSHRATQRIQA